MRRAWWRGHPRLRRGLARIHDELTAKHRRAARRDPLGRVHAREIAEAINAAVAAARTLNAYTVETPEDALAAADAADKARGKGDLPSLAGIPLGIKDLFATQRRRHHRGSHILKGFKPPYESTVTANLRKAGAGMLGKLNMDEFAMGSSNETSAYGPVISPWRRKGSNVGLTPGGSSGGSAAAVAARHRAGRDRHRHRRLDPPARRLRRHLRDQADLRPLLALGDRRLRQLARPGGADGAGRCATARSCSRRWPGSTRRIRPRSTCRCRSGRRTCRAISRASASAFRRNIASTACPRTSTRCGTRASNGSRTPARSPSRSACRTPNMRCRPITSSRPPRRRRTSPAMTACATACAKRA